MKYLQMLWDFSHVYPEIMWVFIAFMMGRLGTMPDWAYLVIYLLYVLFTFMSYLSLPDEPETIK